MLLTFAEPLGAHEHRRGRRATAPPVAVGTPQVGARRRLADRARCPNPLPKGELRGLAGWSANPTAPGGGSSTFSFTVANDTAATAGRHRSRRRPRLDTRHRRRPPPSATVTPTSDGSTDAESGIRRAARPARGCSARSASPCCSARSVLIAIAWPEGVEYILTVRFLRSAWLLTLAFAVFNVGVRRRRRSPARASAASLSPTAWGTSPTRRRASPRSRRVIFVAPHRVGRDATRARHRPGDPAARAGAARARRGDARLQPGRSVSSPFSATPSASPTRWRWRCGSAG